jgi:hypothetical protein
MIMTDVFADSVFFTPFKIYISQEIVVQNMSTTEIISWICALLGKRHAASGFTGVG